ncbi:MAG: hypothetical protein ACYS1C_04415 [Planctomycetota bacterium]
MNPERWGVSTRYIGANEGQDGFDIADLLDCGINSYRILGSMNRFEPEDDDGVYGSPSIEEIKANPSVIPWERWDAVMDGPTHPESGLDLSSRQLFEQLAAAGISPLVTLRNRDDNMDPSWSPAVPQTDADWNEWWEHVFALVYWLNVRNDYRVDDFEVLHAPDVPEQGWTGTQQQYFELLRRTQEAVSHVYATYLPGRNYRLHAPVAELPATGWVLPTLRDAGDAFNCLNVHWGIEDHRGLIRLMHSRLAAGQHPSYPLWISQWGTYGVSYDRHDVALMILRNIFQGNFPAHDYVYGSNLFSLYAWGGRWGLLQADGRRTAGYYALRMACRALQGGRPTFQVTSSDPVLEAIATKGPHGRLHLLVLTWSSSSSYRVVADVSGFLTSGRGVVWEFSRNSPDRQVGTANVEKGYSFFDVPADGAVLVIYESGNREQAAPTVRGPTLAPAHSAGPQPVRR